MCKSAPRSRQITTPAPHHSVFYRPDALPAAQPTASKHWRHIMLCNKKKYKNQAGMNLTPPPPQNSNALQLLLLFMHWFQWHLTFNNVAAALYSQFSNNNNNNGRGWLGPPLVAYWYITYFRLNLLKLLLWWPEDVMTAKHFTTAVLVVSFGWTRGPT